MDPQNLTSLMAGSSLSPYGDYDVVLEELGPLTLYVEYWFFPEAGGVAYSHRFVVEKLSGSWWATNSVTIPTDEEYIGGTWWVKLVFEGDSYTHHGTIIATE